MSTTSLSIASSVNARAGKEITVAVSINTDIPSAISALDLTINFDASQLEPLSQAASAGALTQQWGMPVFNTLEGTIITSQASAISLSAGNGEILILNLKIKDDATGSISINLDEKSSSVQEGKVEFTAVDGLIETIRSSSNYTLPNPVKNLILLGRNHLKGYGNSSNNRLTGNSGNNLLNGKGGIDVMIGKGGNDTYIVNHTSDRVIEKAKGGTDTIKASVNETLSANVENLVLTGKKNLKGFGSSSNNRLTGNSGNNVLEGRAGRDTLTGKGGGDRFVYRSIRDSGITNSTRDTITDFNGTRSDVIDLSKIDANTSTSGNQTFTYIGSDPFSGTQGEVRFRSGILSVNTGTDTTADMQIKLNGVTEFSSEFLIL